MNGDVERKNFVSEVEAEKAGLISPTTTNSTNNFVYFNLDDVVVPFNWPKKDPYYDQLKEREKKELEKLFPLIVEKKQEDDPTKSYISILQDRIKKLQEEVDKEKILHKQTKEEYEELLKGFQKEEPTKSEGALRYNQGKNRLDLIPPEFIEEVGKVFTFGATKYEDNNWKKGLKFSNIIASLERHLLEIKKGNDYDDESNLLHAAHIGCNTAFLIWNYQNRKDMDDRYIQRPLRIGLDIDDVVLDFIGAYCERYNLPEPNSWHFDPLFPERYKELCQDKEFWLNLKPLIDPKELTFEPTVYITARQCGAEITKQWLKNNGWSQVPVEIVGLNESKIDIAKKYQLDIFVDDKYDTFWEFNQEGLYCLLMDRSHNRQQNGHNRRIKSLKEINNKNN